MKKNSSKMLLALCSVLLSTSVYANPPHYPTPDLTGGTATLWRITDYDDTSTIQPLWATQDICFVQGPVQGTNATGLWYSTTYNRWLGRWRQEGDHVVMIGDFWTGPGNDTITWDITVGEREGFGQWEEWVEDSAYGAWYVKANAKLVKVGPCQWQPPIGTTVTWAEIERLALQEALKAPVRTRQDGVIPYPSDRLQLPLVK